MVSKIIPRLKKYNKGITLIEIIVIVFIIALFSMFMISSFPKIQRQYALSRATHKLAQDLRRAEDLGLSGVRINDSLGQPMTKIMGYGIHVDFSLPSDVRQYIIYADIDDDNSANDNKYNDNLGENYDSNLCNDKVQPATDCVIEIVDVSQQNPYLYIKQVDNVEGNGTTSINFSPPGPIVNIENLADQNSEIGIVLGLNIDDSATRTVWINTSGLINAQ